MGTIFPPFTLDEVQALLPGVPLRTLKETLRKHGCASQIGGNLFVSLEQFQRLLKETEICSKSSGVTESLSSTELPLASLAFERALELATQKSQKTAASKKKRVLPAPPSTVPSAKQLSPRQPSSI